MANRSKGKKGDRGGTPATVALERAGIEYALHRYQHRSDAISFGAEAADQLGVDQRRLFKTLIADVTAGLVVAVVPVAGQLDLKALAKAVGGKRAQLADPAAATRSSGYVLGGISPLGQRTPLPTVIDQTALGYATVYVSAGRRGLQLELDPADLITATEATTAPIGS